MSLLLHDRLEIEAQRGHGAKLKQFTAIIHQAKPNEGGYWATCLEVPGASGQGESKDESVRNLGQAVQFLLEAEREEAFCLDPAAETAHLLVV